MVFFPCFFSHGLVLSKWISMGFMVVFVDWWLVMLDSMDWLDGKIETDPPLSNGKTHLVSG